MNIIVTKENAITWHLHKLEKEKYLLWYYVWYQKQAGNSNVALPVNLLKVC